MTGLMFFVHIPPQSLYAATVVERLMYIREGLLEAMCIALITKRVMVEPAIKWNPDWTDNLEKDNVVRQMFEV